MDLDGLPGAQDGDAEELDVNDPLEPLNRVIFGFNEVFNFFILEPVAKTYNFVLPEYARERIGNFLANIRNPVVLVNDLLQGELERGMDTGARLVINTTLGLGGLFDVAEEMGFPHYVLDYENVFRDAVMDEFADSYLGGATPVPCIRCNERVKFKDLLETARDLDADCMATGHYIQRKMGAAGAELHCAADTARDQSYFLFSTTQEQLDYLRFPLGHLESKEDTRRLAAKHGLPVADKPDSQDICFVPDGNYAGIVKKCQPDLICNCLVPAHR